MPTKTWCASYISDGHVGMYNHWANWTYTLWPNSSTLDLNPQLKTIADHSLEVVLRNSSLKKKKGKGKRQNLRETNKTSQYRKKKHQSNESILIIKMLKKLEVNIWSKEKEQMTTKKVIQNKQHDHKNTSCEGLEIKNQENSSQNKETTKWRI